MLPSPAEMASMTNGQCSNTDLGPPPTVLSAPADVGEPSSGGGGGSFGSRVTASAPQGAVHAQLPLDPALLLQGVPHYQATEVIGGGSFGLVLRGLDLRRDPPTVLAFKVLPRGDFVRSYKTYVKREIVHQSCLRHPLIIGLKEVFLTPSYLGIAMEYAQGGDLHPYLASRPEGRVGEEEARWLFQQLMIALDYCHRRGVANRDLKLENLLLDSAATPRPLLKMCDFGYSKHELNSSAKTCVGSTAYMSPEVIMGANKYDAKLADVWSCGIILFTMLTGTLPFHPSDPRFARKVVSGDFTLPTDRLMNAECAQLISLMLQPDPNKRIDVEGIMSHPWFQSGLPAGARHMNDLLLQQEMNMGESHYRVDQMIEQAAAVGHPSDPVQVVVL